MAELWKVTAKNEEQAKEVEGIAFKIPENLRPDLRFWPGHLLDGKVLLPFIERDLGPESDHTGDRLYGVESIKKFADKIVSDYQKNLKLIEKRGAFYTLGDI